MICPITQGGHNKHDEQACLHCTSVHFTLFTSHGAQYARTAVFFFTLVNAVKRLNIAVGFSLSEDFQIKRPRSVQIWIKKSPIFSQYLAIMQKRYETVTSYGTTSSPSNLTTGRIAVARGRSNDIRQLAPVCTPPNTYEFKSQTASRSVQPFLQDSLM